MSDQHGPDPEAGADRRDLEEQLRAERERLRLCIEHAPAAIAIFDQEMRYLAVSRRYLADYRIGPEVLGRSHYEVFPEVPARWKEIHRRCLQGAVERADEDPFWRHDGHLDWIRWELRPWLEASGKVGGLVLFSEVITARKQAQEQLAAERERARTRAGELQAVLDAVPAAVFITRDRDARRVEGNRFCSEALGLRPGANLSRTAPANDWPPDFRILRGGAEVPPEELPVQRSARTGEVVRGYACEVTCPEGVRHLLGNAAPLRDASGRPAGAVGAFLDVTEQRQLEEQVHQAQKLESIGRLAGGVAHDFNNLLMVILTSAEGLAASLRAGQAVDPEDVQQIQEAGARARDLTRRLLAFARKQEIAPVRLDVGAALRGAERLLNRVVGPATLEVRAAPGLWPIRCDPSQLEQVLLNLAVNARDAMPDGGVLTIEAENRTGHSGAGEPAAFVQLSVRDTGAGMSAEVRSHLFEPFYTTKPKGSGTGLGLATVYGIVRQAGGHIHVESAPGRGTTFRLCFPRLEGEPAR